MRMPRRWCLLTNEGSEAQRLGQPLHWRKLIKVNALWGFSLGSQPALWGPTHPAVSGDTFVYHRHPCSFKLQQGALVTPSLRRNLDDSPKLRPLELKLFEAGEFGFPLRALFSSHVGGVTCLRITAALVKIHILRHSI